MVGKTRFELALAGLKARKIRQLSYFPMEPDVPQPTSTQHWGGRWFPYGHSLEPHRGIEPRYLGLQNPDAPSASGSLVPRRGFEPRPQRLKAAYASPLTPAGEAADCVPLA